MGLTSAQYYALPSNQRQASAISASFEEWKCSFYSEAWIPGTHNGNFIPRNFQPFKIDNQWWGFDTVGTGAMIRVYPTSECRTPDTTPGPCVNVNDYGISLRDTTFAYEQEAAQFLAQSTTNQISVMDNHTAEIFRRSKSESTPAGIIYDLICTDYYIDNLSCFIEYVSYDRVPEYDLFIAKYYFPNGIPTSLNSPTIQSTFTSPDGYFYVTTGGRLCYLKPRRTGGDPPIILPPPVDVITPDIPIVGAGQVYIPITEFYSDVKFVTNPLWPDNNYLLQKKVADALIAPYDDDQLSYGFQVYSDANTNECRKELFRVAYGDYDGLGMPYIKSGQTLTKAVYSQYANLLLDSPEAKFEINNVEVDTIYVIDINRERYKNWLDAGNIELNLMLLTDALNYGTFNPAGLTTGAINLSLVDTNVGLENPNEFKHSYSIRPGTLESGISSSTEYGLIFPKHGIIILSANQVALSNADLAPVRSDDSYGYNAFRFYKSIADQEVITAGSLENADGDPIGFQARYIDLKFVKYAIARVKSYNCNFSNNPSFVNDENQLLPEMIGNPVTYPTAIGLYNSKKELLAVGKFASVEPKNFKEEMIINVRFEL